METEEKIKVGNVCNICYTEVSKLKCNQCVFECCSECINSWISSTKSRKCPMCSKVESINLDYSKYISDEDEDDEDDDDDDDEDEEEDVINDASNSHIERVPFHQLHIHAPIHISATNYNVFRVMSGMGGLTYTN